MDKKGEAVNRAALGETTRIIENYIQQFMEQEQNEHREMEEMEEEPSISRSENSELEIHLEHQKKMKEVLHNEMRELLGNDFKNNKAQ